MCDKDDLYRMSMIKQVSQNAKHLGQDWNISSLEQEGEKNEKNPGRAIGKAAAATAAWYLGGGLMGGAGGAAGQTAEQAAELAAQQAAEEAAKQAAMQAAMQGGEQAATQVPQGLLNTMEAGMMDTGYTPSSLFQAIKNTGETTPLQKNLLNFGKQQMMNAQNGGLLNTMDSNLGDKRSMQMMKQGMGMMEPPPQQPMPQAPPRQQASQEPLPLPYENAMDGPPPGMSREEWEMLKRKRGLLGRM